MTSAGKDRQLSLFGSNDSNEPSDADELALAELEVEELASVAFEPEDLVDDIDEDDLDDEDREAEFEVPATQNQQAPTQSSYAPAQSYSAPGAPASASGQSSYAPAAQTSGQASGQTPFQSKYIPSYSAPRERPQYAPMSDAEIAALEVQLLDRLNPEQAQCVSQMWGPSLIIAGAGSGKTTVLTKRIAWIISKLRQEPESILAVTFTNKAAGEMRQRIEKIVGPYEARRISIGTFHSICAKLLRQEISNYKTEDGLKWDNNFVIYDETDSMSLVKAQIIKLNLDDKVFVPKEIRHTISSLKNDGYTHHVYAKEAKNYREGRLSEIFSAYQTELARNNALDFDDLILIFTDLMQQNQMVRERMQRRYRHVLVDEFQDTNKSQYDLISMIAKADSPEHFLTREAKEAGRTMTHAQLWSERSLLVVGDVDQSIYSWRKADYRIILGFQKDYEGCGLIKLEENYRSTATILEVANSIIANNTERIDKTLRCNRGQGGKVNCYEAQDEIDEAYYCAEEIKRSKARDKRYSDHVVLYRTNSQSRAIEEILVRSHIPYVVVGGTRFYDRQEIKDMLAYMKLIYNPRDGQAFNRVINTPKRGLGKTTLDRVNAYAETKGVSPLEASLEASRISDLSPKAYTSLQDFARIIVSLNEQSKVIPVSDLLEEILKSTGYISRLEKDAHESKDELALGRIENVMELVAVAKEFEQTADEPDLDSFLTRISLVSDLDKANLDEDTVKLMTIHSSKGLEFPVAFIMGCEEGLFPHVRSLDSPTQMEEERRLMYVAVTRAGDTLHMTLARKRTMIGRGFSNSGFSSTFTIPSRFLKEITPGLISGFYPSGDEEFKRSGGGNPNFNGSGGFGAFGGNKNSQGYTDESQEWDDRNDRKKPGNFGDSKYGGNDYATGTAGGYKKPSGGYGGSGGSSSSYSGGARSSSGYGSGSGSKSGGASGGSSWNKGQSAGGYNKSTGYQSQNASRPMAKKAEPVKPRAMRLPPPSDKPDVSEAPTFERLKVGDAVQHVKFGLGKVTEVIGNGEKEIYNVAFEDRNRVLDPKFAKLIKLS